MNKEIIYIAFVNDSHIGVSKKIASQVEIWIANGYKVSLIKDIQSSSLVKIYLNRYYIFFRYFVLNRSPRSFIYLRQTTALPLYNLLLKMRNFSYEINADILAESKNYSFIQKIYFTFFPQLLHTISTKSFYVSAELANRLHQTQSDSYVFPNSLQRLPIQRNKPRANNVVFVGTPEALWQGFDIFIKIAENMPSYIFHVIGADSGPSIHNLKYHGTLTGVEYYKTMLEMDYAIGTLAFYRSGISEGSALKVRDYISFNLPTVIGYNDSDFSSSEFILQIDSESVAEQTISIKFFFEAWKNRSISIPFDSDCYILNREKNRAKLITA